VETEIRITAAIEELAKVRCFATDCEHHLFYRGELSCNLKYLDIDGEGKCKSYRQLPPRKSPPQVTRLDKQA